MNASLRKRFSRISLAIPALLGIAMTTAINPALAQQKSDFAGDYTGVIGPVRVTLHVRISPDGNITANVASPQQGLFALQCADIQINGPALTFSVPNVRGEWTGVMSADHNTLSGVWKQGQSMALVFTRGTGSAPGPAAPPVGAAFPGAVNSSRVAPPAQPPPCASLFGVNYWDGSGWKTMTMAAHLGEAQSASVSQGLKALGRNPFNVRAGYTNVLILKHPAATLTLEASPKFCISLPANIDPTVVMIGSLEVKKDRRELETCGGPCASKATTTDDWMPEKRVQPVDIKRLSDTTIEITPKNPLPPGQYILGGPPLVGYFDFGVAGDASGQ